MSIIIGKAQAVGLRMFNNHEQGALDRVIEDICLNEAMATAAIDRPSEVPLIKSLSSSCHYM